MIDPLSIVLMVWCASPACDSGRYQPLTMDVTAAQCKAVALEQDATSQKNPAWPRVRCIDPDGRVIYDTHRGFEYGVRKTYRPGIE